MRIPSLLWNWLGYGPKASGELRRMRQEVERSNLGRLACRLERIFCPKGCGPQFTIPELWAITLMVRDEVFKLHRFQAPRMKRVPLNSIGTKTGESDLHRLLKAEIAPWVMKRCCGRVDYELGYEAGISDVSCSCGRVQVECGATRPSKIWQLFELRPEKSDSLLVVYNREGFVGFSEGKQILKFRKQEESLRRRIFGRGPSML